MKLKNIFVLTILLIFSIVPWSWANSDGGSDNGSPFHDGVYFFQGYTILEFLFPNGDKEYAAVEQWGTNPKDGKGAVSPEHISARMKYFMDTFGFRYDASSGKYDIYSQPTMIGLLDEPDHGGPGDGRYIEVEDPYALTQEELAQLAKDGIVLINPTYKADGYKVN